MDSISHYKLLLYGIIARNRIIVASGTYVSNTPVGRKITDINFNNRTGAGGRIRPWLWPIFQILDFDQRSVKLRSYNGESEEEMIQLSTTYSQKSYPFQLIILDLIQCVWTYYSILSWWCKISRSHHFSSRISNSTNNRWESNHTKRWIVNWCPMQFINIKRDL